MIDPWENCEHGFPGGVGCRECKWGANPFETRKLIVVTGTFVGFHKWPEAPNEVSYLRELHRHLFTFKVYFEVTHNERQLEFHIQKEKVAKIIWNLQESHDVYAWSCETWAEKILNACIHHNDPVTKVEIWEDNECGAIVEKV